MLPSEARYQKAREFTDVVLKLWDSYPSSAIKADKQSGQYADIDQIQPIAHHGDYFDVQGPLNVPKRPGGDIPLFQAARLNPDANLPPVSPMRFCRHARYRCWR